VIAEAAAADEGAADATAASRDTPVSPTAGAWHRPWRSEPRLGELLQLQRADFVPRD
jgi:hypothetical protein